MANYQIDPEKRDELFRIPERDLMADLGITTEGQKKLLLRGIRELCESQEHCNPSNKFLVQIQFSSFDPLQFLVLDDVTIGDFIHQTLGLLGIKEIKEKYYCTLEGDKGRYINKDPEFILPNDSKAISFKSYSKPFSGGSCLNLELQKFSGSKLENSKNFKPLFTRTIMKNSRSQKRGIDTRVLSQPDLRTSLKSKEVSNNNRYTVKDSSEDEIIQKLSSCANTPGLDLDEIQHEQPIEDVLFPTCDSSKINHTKQGQSIDYLNNDEQLENQLKTMSYNGAHKRHGTITYDTLDVDLCEGDGYRGRSSERYTQNRKLQKGTSNKIFNKNTLQTKLMSTGSFENYIEPVVKDPLTEQRGSRRNKNSRDSRKSIKDEARRASEKVKLPNKLSENLAGEKAPLNKNEHFKRKLIKKKSKPSSINYMKTKIKNSSGKHSRTNSKSNMILGPDLMGNIQSGKNSGRGKKSSKCSTRPKEKKGTHKNHPNKEPYTYSSEQTLNGLKGQNSHLGHYLTKDNISSIDKENLNNDQTSKRYSDIMFKESIDKEESISGMNELNLLQELTNFTNMKMMKGRKDKEHCIHFDRVINNDLLS